MSIVETIEQDELDVPAQAVRALAAASKKTRKAGLRRVLVQDGELVELRANGKVERTIKPLKLRLKVERRILSIAR